MNNTRFSVLSIWQVEKLELSQVLIHKFYMRCVCGCVCVCVCVCMCVYIYIYTHTHTYTQFLYLYICDFYKFICIITSTTVLIESWGFICFLITTVHWTNAFKEQSPKKPQTIEDLLWIIYWHKHLSIKYCVSWHGWSLL